MGRHYRLVGLLAALVMVVPLGPAAARAAGTTTVSTCDEAHLRAAVTAAGAGGTVTFACSGKITLATTLTIAQDLTIDGSGRAVRLSGGQSVGVFVVNSGVRLTLNNLTIVNGNASAGGGILNNGALSVSNSAFSGNNANGSGGSALGGAIDNNGTLSVSNSAFSGNGANNGGGFGGTGGAIYNNGGSVKLTTSTFSANNVGDNDGGAIASAGGTLTISGSTFSDNTASFGGAIDNVQTGAGTGGTLTISNSTFSGNNVGHPEGCMCGGSGGAILNNGLLSVSNSTFSGNTAPGGGTGGGIVNGGTASVVNSTFSGNSAAGGEFDVGIVGGNGGAISNGGTLTVSNSTFSGNTAPGGGSGGGIFNAGTASVVNSTLSGNSAATFFGFGGTGGGINNSGTLRVTNSTLSGNSAAGDQSGPGQGGGIFNASGTATLANTIVANSPSGGNCAIRSGANAIADGGGNLDDGTTCGFSAANHSLSNTNPRLLPLASNGGPTQTMALPPGSPAIGAGLAATCLSTGPSGVNNLDQRGKSRNAGTRGRCESGSYDTGGPGVDDSPPVLSLPATIKVSATSAAGAVVTYTVSATDPDNAPSQITIRCTPPSGSTFPVGVTTVNCTASDPAGNTADGSFQVVVEGTIHVTVSTCDEAHLRAAIAAVGPGGTVTFSCSGTITLAATLTIAQDLTIDGSGRTVTLSGGLAVGVFAVNAGVRLTLNNLTIANGSAITGGGVLNNGTLSVVNSTLSGNSADGNGGAIENDGTLSVSNSVFSNNGSPFGVGGAIDNNDTASVVNSIFNADGNAIFQGFRDTLSVASSTFTANHAGAIFNNAGTASVTNSTFSGNSGGGIVNFGTLNVAGSTFSGNSAGTGGGIFNQDGTVSVTNSTFSGNNAMFNGGAIENENGPLRVTNSTFSGNSVTNTTFGGGGGAIDNSDAPATLANTIVANSPSGGNCAFGFQGAITDAGGNLDDGTTCGFSTANHSLSSTNPRLLPLANNGGPTQTMALPPGSPAIGAGLAPTCLSTAPTSPVDNLDQRSQSRNAQTRGVCDSGAFDTGGHPADTTPPSCALTATLAGPPMQIQVTVRDTGSGLATVQVLQSTNSTVAVPAFSRGTTSPVVVTATKVDQSLASQVALQATDVAGNVTRCDPVLTSIIRDEHQPTVVVVRGIDQSEGVLHIANGDPGLSHLVVLVDGRKVQERDLEPNEQRTVSIAAALQPGDANTVVVIARGKQRGEATLVIADS